MTLKDAIAYMKPRFEENNRSYIYFANALVCNAAAKVEANLERHADLIWRNPFGGK